MNAYEYKDDPGDLDVCHECNNPICVNPEHLFAGTHGDNMRHRGDTSYVPIGCLNPRAILCENVIPEIRLRIAAGESYRSIGKSYGVSKSTISNINDRRAWGHVP